MINESDLRDMSEAERRELAHLLTVIDYPSRLRPIQLSRGRWVGGLAAAIACLVLAAWIVVLFLTLNRSRCLGQRRLRCSSNCRSRSSCLARPAA